MHADQDSIRRAKRVRVDASPAYLFVNLHEVPKCLKEEDYEEKRVQEDERQEVLVVAIPEAIVDEWAVMVEVFHTLVADGAMEGRLRLDYFTIRAQVVQVKADVQGDLNQLVEVVDGAQVAWLQ